MMRQLNAVITGIAASLPDYILTNEELSTMVDTTDEWIMTRVGIKERRILKGEEMVFRNSWHKSCADLLAKQAPH